MVICMFLFAYWLVAPAASLGQTGNTSPDFKTSQTSTAPAPRTSSDAKPLPDSPSSAQTPVPGQNGSKDRLFWALPNFLTVENAQNIPPLTSKEKFKIVWRSAFDPVEYPYAAFLAGISQATDSEPGYGQGLSGYGKRFGAAFADNTVENFTTGAILPSLLHQDPRYFQSGHGTFKHRAGYAVSRLFITRGDSGRSQFNASEILGSAISAGVGNAYRPTEDRTVGETIRRWWTQIGWDSVAVGVKEFWPDIRRKIQKRHQKSDPAITLKESSQE